MKIDLERNHGFVGTGKAVLPATLAATKAYPDRAFLLGTGSAHVWRNIGLFADSIENGTLLN